MLKRVGTQQDLTGACVTAANAAFPAPFRSGLEYGAPARGTWNIVHVGMLIPEAHEIFVCASNCLRGVVLTAAEMGASHRFSTVTIREENVLEGDMEALLVDGVSNILTQLPKLPPAVMVYTSCIHHFMACDLSLCYQQLRQRFPGVAFTDCYMNPIMRKSGLTPDQLMRRQLYTFWEPKPLEDGFVNIIGCNIPTSQTSDLVQLIEGSGHTLRDITLCKTYQDYQDMAASRYNISYLPMSAAAGAYLEHTYGQTHLYLPLSYGASTIRQHMSTLAQALGCSYDGTPQLEAQAEQALAEAKALLGDTAIAIDYTATTASLSLARMLLEHGFRVEQLYADSFSPAEQEDFDWLRVNAPQLMIYATVQVKLRTMTRKTEEPVLAIGQKAAYFTGTTHFVNMVEGGGMYGFDGIRQLAEEMKDAFLHTKDTPALIGQKGLGCSCCL